MNRPTESALACLLLVILMVSCQPVVPPGLEVQPTAASTRSTAGSTSTGASGVTVATTEPLARSAAQSSATVEACYTTPIRGFGKIWADHVIAQEYVGCPFAGGEKAMNFVAQRFEHGAILWLVGLEYPADAQDQAYVLFEDDGTFIRVPVDWEPQLPSPMPTSEALSSEPFEPQGMLAEVWREGPAVRARLGLAVEPEAWGTGAWEQFARGWMFWIPYRQSAVDGSAQGSFEERDRWIYVLATYWPAVPRVVRNEWLQFLDTWE